MSLLPQRKKSPAEITQLRASLGIPSLPPGEELVSPLHGAPALAGSATLSSAEDAPPNGAPASVGSSTLSSVEDAPPNGAPTSVGSSPLPKPVRSLKRFEQLPSPASTRQAAPPADSNLPFHRHSDDEIERIRRSDVLAMRTPVVNPKLVPAHPASIGLGYGAVLSAAVAAAWPLPATTPAHLLWIRYGGHALALDPRQLAIPGCCAAVALLVAAGIVLIRPFSRHHAAFISVTTLFVIIFSAIHYFPHLRHGT